MNLIAPKLPFLLASGFTALFGISLLVGVNRTGNLALALTLVALASAWLFVNRYRLIALSQLRSFIRCR